LATKFTDQRFWTYIDRARAAGPTSKERLAALNEQLEGATAGALGEFQAIVLGWTRALDRFDLRAAASTQMNGCDDEAFLGFRSWLIMQGRAAIEAVVQNLDALVSLKVTESPRVTGLAALADARCQHDHGSDVPGLEFTPDTGAWPADRLENLEWTDADCKRLFPKLVARPLWKRQARAAARPARPSAYDVARKGAVGEPAPYSRDTRFRINGLVEHPTFGVGVVAAVGRDRVDVIFPDKTRVLLHGLPTAGR
jgi:hypothetical protein